MNTEQPQPKPGDRRRRSLLRDLRYGLLGVVAGVSVLTATVVLHYFIEQSQQEYQANLSDYTTYLGKTLELPLWDMEDELVKTICQAFATHENIALLRVRNDQGRVLCDLSTGKAVREVAQSLPIRHGEQPVGELELGLDAAYYQKREFELLIYSLATTLTVVLAVGILLRLILGRLLQKPMAGLIEHIQRLAEGNYRIDIAPDERREFAIILYKFNEMAGQVAAREQSLWEVNRQLSTEVVERQRAESVARQSERKYRDIFNNAPLGIIRVTAQGKLVDANPETVRLFGYESSKSMLASANDAATQLYVRPEDQRNFLQQVRDCESGVVKFETELQTSGGRDFPAIMTARPIRDDDGNIVHLEVFVEDITERKQAEQALRDSEQRFRALFEQAAVGVAQVETATARFVRVNRRYCEIVGYSEEEMRRSTLHEITYPEDRQACMVQMAALLAGEIREYIQEKRYCRKDGSIVWVNLTVSPMWAPGEPPRYFVSVAQDISARVRAEEELRQLNAHLEQLIHEAVAQNREKDHLLIQQSRLAAMGEMVHNIAHQWRQPLSALSLIVHNIADDYAYGELTAETLREAVSKSRRLLERMSTTVDDFRDFFRPDKEAVDFELGHAVEDAIFIIEDSLKNNHVALERSLEPGLIGHGYPNQFAQAILNLLVNAKETIMERKVDGGRIDIALHRRDREAVLTVQDNAGGIDPTILPKIFDPYFTTKEQGSGIGLYMAKMIVERNMNGRVTAANSGAGALLTLAIPLTGAATGGPPP
ncbi:MAG: domain S-box [Proteobacteria bacterium]|nr:domain S-box [Pseudomonadota bacterium]